MFEGLPGDGVYTKALRISMRTEMAIGMTAGGLTGAGLLIAGVYQRNRLAASQSWPGATGPT